MERIGKHLVHGEVFLQSYLTAFAGFKPYLVNLKSLHVHDSNHRWVQFVRMCSKSMTELRLDDFDERVAEELSIFTETFPNLCELNLGPDGEFSDWIQSLSSVLKTFGDSVHSLEIDIDLGCSSTEEEDQMYSVLCTHCPSLTRFDLLCEDISFGLYNRILHRYGSQVREAQLWDYFDQIACHQILEACPDACLSYREEFRNDSLDFLQVIASRLQSLIFNPVNLGDTYAETLVVCMKKLKHVSAVTLFLNNRNSEFEHSESEESDSEQTEESIIFDAFGEAENLQLESLEIEAGGLSGTSLRKLLPVV